MLKNKNRYSETRKFTGDGLNEPPFRGMRPRSISTPQGVLEHTIKAWERIDHLSRYYYNEDQMWWRILDANPDLFFAEDGVNESTAGSVLLIPRVSED